MLTITRWRRAITRLGALAGASLLAACGGGGGSGATPTAANNDPVPTPTCTACSLAYITLTDADGDFLSYTVDVVSLKLKRANGATVETLPGTTRIDFAQYVELTEFLTAATVPNGDYVAATLRLDYSNADITVEQNGVPVAGRAVDANGKALEVVDVALSLDNRHHLVVAPGRPSLFSLDFNLAATNDVDLATSPATVTVTPALVASLEPVGQKDLRVRGPLVGVDRTAGTYVVDVRPFNLRDAKLGQVTVHTDANTSFEINGASFIGGAGLDALATAGAGTITAAFGTLTTANHEFDAKAVFAGTSVPGAGIDTVTGEVIARQGNVLTVRGGTINRRTDGPHFARGSVKVTIGDGTRVIKRGTVPPTVLDIGAISVGQSIEAFGTAAPVSSAMSGDWTLDATTGRVRMRETAIYGFVKQAVDGTVTLQLDSIGGRKVSAFDFAGTGANPSQDADPANYEVDTGVMDTSKLNVGEPTKLVGFPTAFGAAPPDFDARTLVDFPRLPAQLAISWRTGGTTAPFSGQNPDSLLLNLGNPDIGRVHALSIGPRVINLLTMPASPAIVAPAEGASAYLIVARDGSQSFGDFAGFVAELTTRLNGTTVVMSLTASGSYRGESNVLTARSIVVVLK